MTLTSSVERDDRRSPSEVGRRARLELAFEYRDGRTILAEAYAEPPFRVGRCFAEGDGLHLILASSAPGVFGGDCLQHVIRVGRGARVRLTSQSALQVHPSPDGTVARVLSAYHVDQDASLHCTWDPVIPFAAARFDQQIEIEIADSGDLYWSDALMGGRHARREHWMFSSLAHELKVSRGSALEYLDRYRIEPNQSDPCRPWVAGAAAYLGTTLVSGPEIVPDMAERLHAELGAVEGVRAAVDAIDRRLLLVRLMGMSGPPFHAARVQVMRALLESRIDREAGNR